MRKIKAILCVMLSMMLMFAFAACTDNSGGGTPTDDVPVTIVNIKGTGVSGGKVSMFKNTNLQLSALIAPNNATNKTVTWASSDTAVATVTKDGLVAAVGAGKTDVTAKAGAITAKLEVTVEATVDIESMAFKKDNYEIFAQKNDAVTMETIGELVFTPVDVTYKSVTYTLTPIGDAPKADLAVSASGELTVIKEKATLNAKYTLTATSTKDTGKSASTTITIKHLAAESLKLRFAHDPEPNATQSYTFPLSYSMYDGLNIATVPQPSGAMDEYEFTSSEPNIVSVVTDSKYAYGTFHIKALGTAKIKATSKTNPKLTSETTISVNESGVNEQYVLIDDTTRANNLNLTAADFASLNTDSRDYWNFDPEGEKYKADRAASFGAWKNTNPVGKPSPEKEMMNSGNGQSIFDGGFAICFDSWDWPSDNDQTNLYVYNKVAVPTNKNVLKARVRTQSVGGTTGKGRFRIRLVNPTTFDFTFLTKDALLTNSEFAAPDTREKADAGVQDAATGWITLSNVPDFESGMDWFHFTVPANFKGTDAIMIFEVDDLHTSIDLGTDGCDRIQLVCLYFADNTNPDPNDLRKEG